MSRTHFNWNPDEPGGGAKDVLRRHMNLLHDEIEGLDEDRGPHSNANFLVIARIEHMLDLARALLPTKPPPHVKLLVDMTDPDFVRRDLARRERERLRSARRRAKSPTP